MSARKDVAGWKRDILMKTRGGQGNEMWEVRL